MLKCVSRILLLVIFALTCGIGISVSDDSALAVSGTATINGIVVNVREGPGLTYNKITTVKKGARFQVLDQQKGWYKISITKDLAGWVTGEYVTVSQPAAINTGSGGSTPASNKSALVTGRVVNIRSGPGTGNPVVAKAQLGQRYTVIGESAGWYKLSLSAGKTGWIIRDYVLLNAAPGAGTPSGGTSVVTSPEAMYVVIKEPVVNIRAGAGTNYSVVAKVKAPERYSVVQQKGEWYLVNLQGQKQGWVAGWVVDLRQADSPSRGDTGTEQPADTANPSEEPPESGQSGNNSGDAGNDSDKNPDAADASKLTDVSFESGYNGQEIVRIDADAPLEYNLFSVADPLRVVIDIKNCSVNGFKDLFANGEMASTVRAAQYSLSPMAVRIVIDLNKVVDYIPSLSQDGKSLTIVLSKPTIEGKTIVIDAGHGEYDPGAIGVTGLKEKDYNLETALLLRDKLEALGVTVIMTRDYDKFISLTERSRIANEAKADVFVSIHANSSTSSTLRGTSTYYYAPSSSPSLYAQAGQRKRLAATVQKELVDLLETRDIGILQANFAVLRGTNMPSILVETAFLSNAQDEALLKDSNFREKVAQGIANGLVQYFSEPVSGN